MSSEILDTAKTVGEVVISDRRRYYPTSEGWQYITLEDVAGITTAALKNNLTNGFPEMYEWAMFKRAAGVAFVIVRKRPVPDARPFVGEEEKTI